MRKQPDENQADEDLREDDGHHKQRPTGEIAFRARYGGREEG